LPTRQAESSGKQPFTQDSERLRPLPGIPAGGLFSREQSVNKYESTSLPPRNRVRDRLLPVNSKRRIIYLIVVKTILGPRKAFANINRAHMRKLIYCMRTGSFTVLLEKIARKLSEPFSHVRSAPGTVSAQKKPRLDEVEIVDFTSHAQAQVSIVMPVRNRWTYTYQCLRSILENTEAISYEVIIVDDGSTDETAAMLGKVSSVKVLKNGRTIGFVESCNRGAREASGRYVLLLNNDTLVTEGWLKSMVDVAERDMSIGIVGAKLIYPNGILQEAGGIVWNNSLCPASNYGRYDDPNKWEYNYVKEVDYCSGACLLVRTDLLRRIGFFDSRYSPGYYEDTDLCFRARELGFKTVYQPGAEIVHVEGATAGVDAATGMKQYQAINQEKFYSKWRTRLEETHAENENGVFLARDRSRNRKLMLYVDRCVPAWDRDAGSFITMEYVRIFLSLGYKIVFWPDNLSRTAPYATELQQLGVEVVYGSVSFRNYIRSYGKHFDVACISRPDIAIDYIDKIRKYSKATLVYIPHDLAFLRERRRADLEHNTKMLRAVRGWESKELYLMKTSDVTIVFSKREKEIVNEMDPVIDIRVSPWIQPVNGCAQGFAGRKDLLFLGGFAHEPNEDGVFWFVKDVFSLIKKQLPAARLLILGSDPTIRILGLRSDDVIVTGFVPDPSTFFREAMVFVAPLRYGAGLKGKVIHAMSYGVPVVTTDIGAEGLGLEDGLTALIATDAGRFAEKVVTAYTDETLWSTLSRNSLSYVEEGFSAQAARDFFSELFRS
jgi:GT2 family glycosyltransferase